MNAILKHLAVVSTLLISGIATAQTVVMDADTVERMGIKTASPLMASAGGGSAYPAVVAIPPGQERQLGFTESVRIIAYHVASGDQVKAGDLLATASSPQLLALQSEYLQANMSLSLARQQYQRDKQLESDGIISANRLRESRIEMDNRNIAAEQHAAMLRMNGYSNEELKSLARSGRLQIETKLRAPMDGVVLSISDGVGQTLEAGEPVIDLADLSSLWLEVRVPLAMADSIAEGTRVEVPTRKVSATVERVSRNVDVQSQTVLLRSRVTEGVESLRPGEAVDVRIGATTGATLSVPRSAVLHAEDKDWVFLRSAEGFDLVEVKLAGSQGDRVMLASGIEADSQVAVIGVAALKGAWMGIGGGE